MISVTEKNKENKIGIYLILGRIRSRIKMKRIRVHNMNMTKFIKYFLIWLSFLFRNHIRRPPILF